MHVHQVFLMMIMMVLFDASGYFTACITLSRRRLTWFCVWSLLLLALRWIDETISFFFLFNQWLSEQLLLVLYFYDYYYDGLFGHRQWSYKICFFNYFCGIMKLIYVGEINWWRLELFVLDSKPMKLYIKIVKIEVKLLFGFVIWIY